MKKSPELVTMSAEELDRLGVIRRVIEGRLPQKQAATMMGVTARQARRLLAAYKREGAAGLVSQKRGRPGNRGTPAPVKERALRLVRELYGDFGPTLAAEKLGELHDLVVSRETLRHWMRVTRDEDVESATGKRFVVRWVRRKAFLYERAVKGEAVGTGRPILEDKLLGQVDATVAQEWQARGDSSVPPPLQAEEPAPPGSADRPPSPAPAVDTSQRLNAALWFTDTFHAAETERLRAAQAAADEAFAAQFRDEPARAAEGTPKSSPRSGRRSQARGAAAAAISRSATSTLR
jgi:hypothetical protein